MAKPFPARGSGRVFRAAEKADPEPKTELQYVNPYTLLVAVALSAQATDKGVNKATAAAVQKGQDAAKRCWRWARRN